METTAYGNTPSTSGMSNNIQGVSNIASSAHSAVDDAARKAKPAIDRVAAMAHQAVDKAASAAGPAADWLTQQGESLNVQQKKLVDDTCSYISANPLKSVGIALAAGFVLSRILR